MDIVGGMFLADGTEAKVVTGVDGKQLSPCVTALEGLRMIGLDQSSVFDKLMKPQVSTGAPSGT
jgi:hypothetical protein